MDVLNEFSRINPLERRETRVRTLTLDSKCIAFSQEHEVILVQQVKVNSQSHQLSSAA
jgi:hypothetical protein